LTVVRFRETASLEHGVLSYLNLGADVRRSPGSPGHEETLAALIAVATIAGSLGRDTRERTGARRRRCRGRPDRRRDRRRSHRSSRPAYGGPVYVEKLPRPAAGFASASGTVTAGASAASRSATDLSGRNLRRLDFETADASAGFFLRMHCVSVAWSKPDLNVDARGCAPSPMGEGWGEGVRSIVSATPHPLRVDLSHGRGGRTTLRCLRAAADRAQHALARPAVHLEPPFLVGAESPRAVCFPALPSTLSA